jgi:hypothetical protein
MAPLLEAAGREGLRIAISKGFHWAERLYGEPGLRPYLDVDGFVHPDEWSGVLDLLRRTGFRPDPGSSFVSAPRGDAPVWTHSPVFRKDGLAVEIHPNPLGLQIPSRAEKGFWDSLRQVRLAGTAAFVPGWPQELAYAALHAQQHSYTRLSWLVDLKEIAGLEGLDWAEAVGLAREEGIEASLAHGLHIVSRCWPGAVPERGTRLFPGGGWTSRASRFFWPVEAVASRRPAPEAPYYMPSILALLRRRRPGSAVRSLAGILWPPRDWVQRQLPGESRLVRARYSAGRLLRPWIYLVRRLIGNG